MMFAFVPSGPKDTTAILPLAEVSTSTGIPQTEDPATFAALMGHVPDTRIDGVPDPGAQLQMQIPEQAVLNDELMSVSAHQSTRKIDILPADVPLLPDTLAGPRGSERLDPRLPADPPTVPSRILNTHWQSRGDDVGPKAVNHTANLMTDGPVTSVPTANSPKIADLGETVAQFPFVPTTRSSWDAVTVDDQTSPNSKGSATEVPVATRQLNVHAPVQGQTDTAKLTSGNIVATGAASATSIAEAQSHRPVFASQAAAEGETSDRLTIPSPRPSAVGEPSRAWRPPVEIQKDGAILVPKPIAGELVPDRAPPAPKGVSAHSISVVDHSATQITVSTQKPSDVTATSPKLDFENVPVAEGAGRHAAHSDGTRTAVLSQLSQDLQTRHGSGGLNLMDPPDATPRTARVTDIAVSDPRNSEASASPTQPVEARISGPWLEMAQGGERNLPPSAMPDQSKESISFDRDHPRKILPYPAPHSGSDNPKPTMAKTPLSTGRPITTLEQSYFEIPSLRQGEQSISDVSISDVRPAETRVQVDTIMGRGDPARPAMMQLSDAARRLADGPVEISLSPEELGRVRMSLTGTDTAMSVQILAERPETLELIRRHIELLAADLREQGFTDLSFSFSGGDPSEENSGAFADDAAGPIEGSALEPVVAAPQKMTSPIDLGHADRLDLRL